MTRNSRNSIIGVCTLAMVLTMAVLVDAQPGPVVAKLCEVFSSPAEYNHKVISVEGVISPSIHSLFLSSPACNAKEDPDFTTQAVLPAEWVTLPNGKELRKYLRRGKSASVKLTGTFEADPQRYGPDGARFRFSISGISSVGAAPPGFHLSGYEIETTELKSARATSQPAADTTLHESGHAPAAAKQ